MRILIFGCLLLACVLPMCAGEAGKDNDGKNGGAEHGQPSQHNDGKDNDGKGHLDTPPPSASPATGRLWLKDADNGDAVVGPSPQQGIPQGHTLKVALGGVRDKAKLAAGSALVAVMHDGSREVARIAITLNATAYGEGLIEIAVDQPLGVYQIRLDRGGKQETGLGGAFRIIEASPSQDLPFGAGGAVLALAAVCAGLFLAWRRPRPA